MIKQTWISSGLNHQEKGLCQKKSKHLLKEKFRTAVLNYYKRNSSKEKYKNFQRLKPSKISQLRGGSKKENFMNLKSRLHKVYKTECNMILRESLMLASNW